MDQVVDQVVIYYRTACHVPQNSIQQIMSAWDALSLIPA